MAAPVSVREDQLTRLVALSPDDGRVTGLVRRVCAQTLSLPSLPVEVAVNAAESGSEAVIAEFAEQFSVDVSAITAEQRSRLWKKLGNSTFGVVVLMYIADFIPRVRAGLRRGGHRFRPRKVVQWWVSPRREMVSPRREVQIIRMIV